MIEPGVGFGSRTGCMVCRGTAGNCVVGAIWKGKAGYSCVTGSFCAVNRGAHTGRAPNGEAAPCQKVPRKRTWPSWGADEFAGMGWGWTRPVAYSSAASEDASFPESMMRKFSVSGCSDTNAYATSHSCATVGLSPVHEIVV